MRRDRARGRGRLAYAGAVLRALFFPVLFGFALGLVLAGVPVLALMTGWGT
ncbi:MULTISPECIES: hypothetical protein [unclassified Crossiella]|uniref:hypothetical protein n=1 Tax=unclassified Crossiella TaxID=2620835 RepID=UPI001FFE4A40|nr:MULTISPECIES: hypothetical protein [unclassified Crossiella]MCK2242183.1 hypothetical protein [Crossiella sp. S99.2]MCK2256086.1 hypothetical protein [Crossiella sp. S99.1]